MSQALLLKPDRKFVEDIVKSGGGDLKKCYQCATCSVVCELSTETAPFPNRYVRHCSVPCFRSIPNAGFARATPHII